jgi:hypothetical protein
MKGDIFNMLDLNVKIIGPDDLPTYWPQCEPLLERGLAESENEMNANHLLPLLQAPPGYLLAGVDAAGTVHAAMALQLQTYPHYTVAHIFSIGGRWVLANRRHWGDVKAWLKQQGANKVQGSCKPAQARLWRRLGMDSVYTIVRQDL